MDLGLPLKWFYDSMICFDILYCKDHWESLITDISEGKQVEGRLGSTQLHSDASAKRCVPTEVLAQSQWEVSGCGRRWHPRAEHSKHWRRTATCLSYDMFIVCLLLMSICLLIQYKCLLHVYYSICQLLIINMVNLFQIIIFLVPFFLLILVSMFCFGLWASLSLHFDMKLCRTTDVGFLSSVTVAPAGGVLLPLVLT